MSTECFNAGTRLLVWRNEQFSDWSCWYIGWLLFSAWQVLVFQTIHLWNHQETRLCSEYANIVSGPKCSHMFASALFYSDFLFANSPVTSPRNYLALDYILPSEMRFSHHYIPIHFSSYHFICSLQRKIQILMVSNYQKTISCGTTVHSGHSCHFLRA